MASIIPKPSYPVVTSLIEAGLHVLTPTDPDYVSREESYWSKTAKLGPICIVQPKTPDEVSQTLNVLVAAQEKFAIRGGGHSPGVGTNNITGGVTIDLGLMDKNYLGNDAKTVTIGAGGRFKNVYQELAKHGLAAVGSREGNVGVGGFILGGGNSWFTSRYGWACDNVVAYQIVLADGRIITADKDNHSDLFQALKGGSNNFGIVTNFTIKTVPCSQVWGGVAVSPKEAIPQLIDVTWNFTEDVPQYRDSNLIVVLGYFPDFKDNVASTAVLDTRGVENGPAYEHWAKLPKIADTVKPTTIFNMSTDMTLPPKYHDAWFTLCFKNDRRIMAKASEVHSSMVEELKAHVPDGDFLTQCIFQPVPTLFAQNSLASGGNVLGIERNKENCILFQISTMMKTPEQLAFAYAKLSACVETVKQYAASVDGLTEWNYMNYADKSQNVLSSYGADNVKKMKDVAAKYDPQQVFQKLCPGGWKISDVSL
ncbi:uncharacterized protein F4822DRAFT_413320 [Hypoxylon trugodes]|uniref:uncharacterized protein n=1 Tax=Hypoxylon trugodes TaxID=326681 RepID=UPI00219D2407|nr:uncharacterized protein F4822DRAFT_413320 [Hypoxylon trugodes]KAI1385522.1 hypothetical protein F4822DRAFT_413320 [Hypoxylon trugodes]